MKIILASRQSDLAKIQAFQVGGMLEEAGYEIEHRFTKSFGDQNIDLKLTDSESKGVFTQDLQKELVREEVDVVVHSWKDLPILDDDAPTKVVATLNREDVRDILFLKKTSCFKRKLTFLTSSPRREYLLPNFIHNYFPFGVDRITFKNIRGNIPTRFVKFLADKNADGFVVAKAAADRILGSDREEFAAIQNEIRSCFSQCYWMVLPITEFPSAPAQGALALEIKRNRTDLEEIFAPFNSPGHKKQVSHEREILKSYGGGCHQKIGATVLGFEFAAFQIVRGETPSGDTIKTFDYLTPPVWPKADSINQIWPPVKHPVSLTSRTLLPPPHFREGLNALFICKIDTVENINIKPFKLRWTAGLKTWQNCAKEGIWINGSQESMGEEWGTQLSSIYPDLQWCKVSHTNASEINFTNYPTYQISVNKEQLDIPKEVTHCFWTSGGLFLAALEKYPHLKNAYHFCGPGNTYNAIFQYLNTDHKVFKTLNYELWKKYVVAT